MNGRKAIKIIFIALLVWNFIIFSAPFFVSSKSVVLQAAGTFSYFFMDPVCHQLPGRSLFLAGLPLPVCARCTFIYLGALFFFAFALLPRDFKSWPRNYYLIFALFFGAEIFFEKTALYHNFLELRIISGFLLGIVLSHLALDGLLMKGFKVKKNG